MKPPPDQSQHTQSPCRSITNSLHPPSNQSPTYSILHPINHRLIQSPTRSITNSLNPPSNQSPIHSILHPINHQLTQSPTQLINNSFNHQPNQPTTQPPTQPIINSINHPRNTTISLNHTHNQSPTHSTTQSIQQFTHSLTHPRPIHIGIICCDGMTLQGHLTVNGDRYVPSHQSIFLSYWNPDYLSHDLTR